MPLLPTKAFLDRDTRVGYRVTAIRRSDQNFAPPDPVPGTGWDTSALPCNNPAWNGWLESRANPPYAQSGNNRVVQWVDGSPNDAKAYSVATVGVFITPTNGREYLAHLESVAAGPIPGFVKNAGSIILRNLRLLATAAQVAGGVTVALVTSPAASTETAGVSEFATQDEYGDGDADRVPTTDLEVPAGRLTVRNGAAQITASPAAPVIRKVGGINSDGRLSVGANGLPVLFIENVSASADGFAHRSGYFARLRLHAQGATTTFAAGDEIYLNGNGTGFAKTGTQQVGYVLSGNSGTGLYEVVLDLWPPFLRSSDYRPIWYGPQGTAFPTTGLSTGMNFRFEEAVPAGLTWRDTDGATPITSAAAGDIARYDGTRWIKQVKPAGLIYQVPE